MARVDLLGLALHAFPRRFRAVCAEEVRATAADAADAGVHLDARALADVVLSGWRERVRSHPPLGAFLAYRFFERPLPSRWHRWVIDDATGWIGVRRGLWTLCCMTPFWVMVGMRPVTIGLLAALMLVVGPATGTLARRRIFDRHRIDPDTHTYAPPAIPCPTWMPPPTVHRRAAPVLLTTGVMLVVQAPLAALPLLAPHLTIGRFGTSVLREADHTVLIGSIAATIAVASAIAGWFVARRIDLGTFARCVPDGGPVAASAPVLVGVVAIGMAGVAASLLPIAPLIVPAGYLVAGGLGPALITAGMRARRSERATGRAVVLHRLTRARAVHG